MSSLRWSATIFLLACVCSGDDGNASIEERVAALRRWEAEGNEQKVRSYLRDEHPWVRVKAAGALLRIRPEDKKAVAVLRTEMHAGEPHIADAAATALGSAGEEGIRILVAEFRKGPAGTAAMCGLISVESIEPRVLRGLKDVLVEILSQSTVPRELGGCMELARRDPTVARVCAPHTFVHLRDGELAWPALDVLKAAGSDESFVAPLRRFIHDEQLEFPATSYGRAEYELASSILCGAGPKGIRAVLDRLATIGSGLDDALILGLEEHIDAAFDLMLQAARSTKPLLRLRLMWPLSRVEGRKRLRSVVSLMTDTMLHDQNADVRAEAAVLLYPAVRRLGELVPMEEEVLRGAVEGHVDEAVRRGALYALLEAGKVSIEFLAKRLDDPSERVRVAAVQALGDRGPPAADALEQILAALERGDSPANCIEALARIAPDDERVLEAASRRLDSENERVAFTAARAVAIIGPRGRKVAERLRALLPTDVRSVRLWRRYALWRVTGQATDLRPLLEDLKRSVRAYGESMGDDLHAVQILSMLGVDARSLGPVIDEALADPDLSGPPRDDLEAARRALGE